MSKGDTTSHKRFWQELPLLFAIFLDLVGFTMVIPDLQFRAEKLGAPGWLIGVILASYFLVQILVSPRWGSLSDRVGRKPVLLICGTLSALSFIAYALAVDLWVLLVVRIFAGLAAANVVVAQAYIADTSDETTRAPAMGRVGAAITAGSVLGPAIGGRVAATYGSEYLGWGAAIAAALGVLWILLGVPHRPPAQERRPGAKRLVFDLSLLRDIPAMRSLFLLSSAAFFALACLEGTFGRLIKLKLGYGPQQYGDIFSYESLLGVLIQAFLIGWVARRFVPGFVLRVGYVMQGVGLAITPYMPHLFGLFVASTFYALGAGLANPTLNALCSARTPDERQGEMFGLLQASRSLGFLIGPVLGGALFDFRAESPYWLSGAVCVGVALMVPRDREAMSK